MTNFYEIQNNVWTPSVLSADKLSWQWIRLYDDDLNFYGVGMYTKSAL